MLRKITPKLEIRQNDDHMSFHAGILSNGPQRSYLTIICPVELDATCRWIHSNNFWMAEMQIISMKE